MSEQTGHSGRTSPAGGMSRRGLLRAAGAGAVVVGGGGLLQACSSGIKGASSGGTKGITIGWIHPLTGALAGFGAPDNWVISKIRRSEEHTSELQSRQYLVCRLLLGKKNTQLANHTDDDIEALRKVLVDRFRAPRCIRV